MKKFWMIGVAFCCSSFLWAQIPAGYYDSAKWKEGEELKTALYNIIKAHTVKNYDDLWSYFPDTDAKTNGQVWDIYSDNPSGTPPYTYSYSVSADQCGNYSAEGDCYNREHTFPKSWFNDASPMYSDLFHIYPTDGYVNNKRGNTPFGEVGSVSWTSDNGSKLGTSNVSGYSGQVFEPIEEYKGDLARTYFYMITRYQNVSSGWSSDMLNNGTYASWALKMLYDWDRNDPVSQKEIDRNNAIYQIQGNRNPFIDHNEYVFKIWDQQVGIDDLIEEPVVSHYFENKTLHISKYSDINVYDISGKLIVCVKSSNELDLNNLNSGLYLIKFDQKTIKYVAVN